MKEHLPRRDFDTSTSSQMQSFVESTLDKLGIDPSTKHGFAKSHHILSQYEAHPQVTIGYPNEHSQHAVISTTPSSLAPIHLHPKTFEPYAFNLSSAFHPAITQAVRKRVINHGDRISNLDELHNHLFNLGKSLNEYRRDFKVPVGSDMDKVLPKDRFIYNAIPQKEQQQISNQIKRFLTHPEFTNTNTETHLTPEHFANIHSNVHHNEGIGRMESTVKSYKPMEGLFRNVLSDPHVRNDFHNFLDHYETRGEPQKRVAAAIRGHMAKSTWRTGHETSRLLTKYGKDSESIDMGRSGVVYFHGHDDHPLNNQIMRPDDARLAKLKETNPEIHRRHAWNTVPIGGMNFLGSDNTSEHHKKVVDKLIGNIIPEKHTKEELTDMLGTAHHVLSTSPTFEGLRKEDLHNGAFGRGMHIASLKDTGAAALAKVLHDESINNSTANRRNRSDFHVEARKIIEGRAAMKAAGITR